MIGLGKTGIAVARFLARQQQPFIALDTREAPANLAEFQRDFPDVGIELGPLREDTLKGVEEIIVSPGVALAEPAIQAALSAGVPVIGDIELFARHARAPIVAITGSNAKSTVTSLVGEMARAANVRVAVGGNIGTPALDLLAEDGVELYVLELSSFQLETTAQLNAKVATILNVSEDHMDRYSSLMEYHRAKQRIYFGAEQVVVNRDDPLTSPPLAAGVNQLSFGLGVPDINGFGLRRDGETEYLSYQFDKLMPSNEMALSGRHNLANGMAALALGKAAGLPMSVMLDTLRRYPGLPHRCERVAEVGGVEFINDSKGTNVGATLAALRGLSRLPNRLVLIAGGDGKGARFDELVQPLAEYARAVVLIGRDARLIGQAVDQATEVIYADDMTDAVQRAFDKALPGDAVLLSPACASFDMFKGFEDRGQHFVAAVEALDAQRRGGQ